VIHPNARKHFIITTKGTVPVPVYPNRKNSAKSRFGSD
jgi:hypothetical protein